MSLAWQLTSLSGSSFLKVLEYGRTNLGGLKGALKSGAVSLAHLPHSGLEVTVAPFSPFLFHIIS